MEVRLLGRTASIGLAIWAALAVSSCGGSDDPAQGTSDEPIKTAQVVNAVTPGKQPAKGDKPRRPSNTAKASKGDIVQLTTSVPEQKAPRGVQLKITLSKGPADTLQATAGGVSGDPTSKTTIKSKGRREISLKNVRYTCFAPPQKTFCPVDVKQTGRSWSFVMKAPVATAPVVLVMVVD